MSETQFLRDLDAIGPRKACSDGERRAAKLLAVELRRLERRPRTEPHWIRPQWPAVWLLHAILGVAGSVAAVEAPAVGLGVLAATAVSALLELAGPVPGVSVLWPRRATQNVMSDGPGSGQIRLLVTAAYDAPRARGGFGAPLARLDRALRRATRGRWPSPLALLVLALIALAGCAGARLGDVEGTWLGAVQLIPSVVCITAVAVLADLSLAPATTAAHPASSAPAAALAIVERLDRRPPRRLEVDVLLAGAGDARAGGMRGFVADRRRRLRPESLAVLHVEPCGNGEPQALRRDGPLLALRLHPQLVGAAQEAGFELVDGRGTSGAYIARRAGWPAVAIGRSGGADAIDDAAFEDTIERAIALVRRLDATIAGRTS
jgi:hypothetical protein